MGSKALSTPQHNVEAYRILGDILTTLRGALRQALEKECGPRWFESELDPGIFGRLVARKEREKEVSAFNGAYFTLLEYADFDDLREICQAHSQGLGFLKAFGPSPELRTARFLELQGMHNKLAGLRDVNDSELSFLQHLSRRLHQLVAPASLDVVDRSLWNGHLSPPPRDSEAPAQPVMHAAGVQDDAPPSASAPAIETPPVRAQLDTPAPAPVTPRSEAPLPPPTLRPAVPATTAVAPPPEPPSGRRAGHAELERALDEGDDKAVIAALFQEVRALSEHILDSQGPNNPPVWDRVSESAWYSRRYASLGMRPVSDFYSLYLLMREKINDGATNRELDQSLREHAFQNVMMAVGVFFQQNRVAG